MSVTTIIVLAGFLASAGVFAYRCYLRFQHLRLGRSAEEFGDWGERLKGLVGEQTLEISLLKKSLIN